MLNITLTTSVEDHHLKIMPNCVAASEVALKQNDKTAEFYVQTIFGFIYTIIFFLGVSGNCLVIVSVRRNTALQSVRNMFIVSLSCSDIAVCLTSVLITPITTMAKNWLFGKSTCYAFPLFQGMSICISAFTLTAIAVDRYILIVHPTRPAISRTGAVCIIVGIWILGASVTLPLVVQSEYFTMEKEEANYNFNETSDDLRICGYFCGERWTSDESKKLYGTVLLMVQFILPLIIITYCYSRISLRLSDAYAKRMLNHHGPLTDRHRVLLRRKQRTNIMLISMVVVFAACWFFQVLINLLNDYEKTPDFVVGQQWLYGLVCHVIAMTSTFWNPVLYAGLNEGFRAAFMEILPCMDNGFTKDSSGDGQRFACNAETMRLRAHSPMLHNELTNWHYNNNDKTNPVAMV